MNDQEAEMMGKVLSGEIVLTDLQKFQASVGTLRYEWDIFYRGVDSLMGRTKEVEPGSKDWERRFYQLLRDASTASEWGSRLWPKHQEETSFCQAFAKLKFYLGTALWKYVDETPGASFDEAKFGCFADMAVLHLCQSYNIYSEGSTAHAIGSAYLGAGYYQTARRWFETAAPLLSEEAAQRLKSLITEIETNELTDPDPYMADAWEFPNHESAGLYLSE